MRAFHAGTHHSAVSGAAVWPRRRLARRAALGVVATAMLTASFASVAGAAGGDDGYGGNDGNNQGADFGGSPCVLVARVIGHSGGDVGAPVHHGNLTVDVPAGAVKDSDQWIVTVDKHPRVKSSVTDAPSGHVLVALAVTPRHHGAKVSAGAPVTVSYSGLLVTPGTTVGTVVHGKFTAIPSIVTGDAVSFMIPTGRSVAIVGG